jgi:hypothetical protein
MYSNSFETTTLQCLLYLLNLFDCIVREFLTFLSNKINIIITHKQVI